MAIVFALMTIIVVGCYHEIPRPTAHDRLVVAAMALLDLIYVVAVY